MKKFMLRVMPIVLVALVVLAGPVFALDIDNTFNHANDASATDTAGRVINNVWGTVLTVLQILAVAAIVFSGVKYMFAGAEGKAEFKTGLIGIVVGAILVFGASVVVKLIMGAAEQAV